MSLKDLNLTQKSLETFIKEFAPVARKLDYALAVSTDSIPRTNNQVLDVNAIYSPKSELSLSLNPKGSQKIRETLTEAIPVEYLVGSEFDYVVKLNIVSKKDYYK